MQGYYIRTRTPREVLVSRIKGEGWRLDVAESYVVVEDYWIPETIEITIGGVDDQPEVCAKVEIRDGAPACTALSFTSREGQREVRQADLRTVEISALVNDLVAGFTFRVDPSTREVDMPIVDSDAFHRARRFIERQRRGPGLRDITPELLERVAEIYRANIDHAPTQAVGRAFNVRSRMASEYVQRARAQGLLPPTKPGKKRA
jgi:hypothetical protein